MSVWPKGAVGTTQHALANEQVMWRQEIRKLAEEASKESRDGIAKAVREAIESAKEKVSDNP